MMHPIESHTETGSEPGRDQSLDGGGAERSWRRRVDRVRTRLGFGWNRNRSLGLHIGDDGIRLAAVDVVAHTCIAVAERRLAPGDIVHGEVRRPEVVRSHLRAIADDFGFPRRRPLAVAIESDIDPVATQPLAGSTSTNVLTRSGREVGEAHVRTSALSWLAAAVVELAPHARIEPVATAVLRCYADLEAADGTTRVVHCSGGRRTRIVLDVDAYERARRPVSVEAATSTDAVSGVWIEGDPVESDPTGSSSNFSVEAALLDRIGDRLHEFAPAIGAALAPNGELVCDFRSGSVITRPADECMSPGWVVQRI